MMTRLPGCSRRERFRRISMPARLRVGPRFQGEADE